MNAPSRRAFLSLAAAALLAPDLARAQRVLRGAEPAAGPIGLVRIEGFVEAPSIRVVGDWGSSDPQRLAAIAAKGASLLFRGLREEEVANLPVVIELFTTTGSPFANYQSSGVFETRLGLSAIDRRWAQFLYQLGHELGHVLCNYKRIDFRANPFQWFEEALCGACAILTLERSADDWIFEESEYANAYDDALRQYVAEIRRNYGGFATEGEIAAWRRAWSDRLREIRGLERLNRRMSTWLADRIAERPERLGSLRYLNTWRGPAEDLSAHFAAWRDACPEDRKEFPERIASAMRLNLP